MSSGGGHQPTSDDAHHPPAASTTSSSPPAIVGDVDDDDRHHASEVETMRSPLVNLRLTRPVMAAMACLQVLVIAFPLCVSDTRVSFFCLLCLLPAALAYAFVYFRRRHDVPQTQLLARFAIAWMGLTPVMTIGWLVAILFFLLFVSLSIKLFLPEPLVVCIELVGIAVCVAGVEETFKLLVLSRMDKYDSMSQPHHYPLFSTATALGTGSAQAYYLVLFFQAVHDAAWPKAPFTVGTLAMLACILTVLLVPMQVLSSYHIGLAVARVQFLQHDCSVRSVVIAAVIARSIFLCGVFVMLVVSMTLGFGICVLVVIAYVVIIKRYERNMPMRYLRKTGYLHVMGYGSLPTDEDAAEAAENATETRVEAGGGAAAVRVPVGRDAYDIDDDDEMNAPLPQVVQVAAGRQLGPATTAEGGSQLPGPSSSSLSAAQVLTAVDAKLTRGMSAESL